MFSAPALIHKSFVVGEGRLHGRNQFCSSREAWLGWKEKIKQEGGKSGGVMGWAEQIIYREKNKGGPLNTQFTLARVVNGNANIQNPRQKVGKHMMLKTPNVPSTLNPSIYFWSLHAITTFHALKEKGLEQLRPQTRTQRDSVNPGRWLHASTTNCPRWTVRSPRRRTVQAHSHWQRRFDLSLKNWWLICSDPVTDPFVICIQRTTQARGIRYGDPSPKSTFRLKTVSDAPSAKNVNPHRKACILSEHLRRPGLFPSLLE